MAVYIYDIDVYQ